MAKLKIADISKNSYTPISYRGYYYLVKMEGSQLYLAKWDVRLGWIVKRLKFEKLAEKGRVLTEKDWTVQGTVYPPYTDKQIKAFNKLTKNQLETLITQSKNT